jgi:GntR family transcriptional repressor for pyruvate dehydrogenase complex
MYARVPRLAARESVVSWIEQLIVTQQLTPGDALPPERELARRLSVSRNVLREALRVLSQKGLIRVEQGRGVFVAQPSSETVRDSILLLLRLGGAKLSELCDVRALIEPAMAALAAERASPEDHAALAGWMAALEDSVGVASDHVAADIGFHRAISAAARHPMLEAVADAVSLPVMESMLQGTTVPRAIADSDDHHRRILDAIVARDPVASRDLMSQHIEFIRAYILEIEQCGAVTEVRS